MGYARNEMDIEKTFCLIVLPNVVPRKCGGRVPDCKERCADLISAAE